MKEINLQPLIDLLLVNRTYFGSVLFGALTSAFIVHRFTKKREKEHLKVDLRVKASEQLLDSVKVFLDASAGMFIPGITSFSDFNSTLNNFPLLDLEPGDDFNTNMTINEINRKQIEQAKNAIFNNMQEYSNLWKTYTKSLISIISILESKEVVFNRFVGFRELILDECTAISEIQNDIMHLYQFEICPTLFNNKQIEERKITMLKELEDRFMIKRIDISAIMFDLRVGVQNDFLSKLFNYDVPLRKPTDKALHVYMPGYVHKVKN